MSRALVDAARSFRLALSSFEPAALRASEAATLAEELARTEKACNAARIIVAARAVECGAHREAGIPDATAWLARQAGTTSKDARQGLELARRLDAHPATKSALLEGSVSIAQAAEVTKADAEMPGAEKALLDIAKTADLSRLRDEVRERRLSTTPAGELHLRQVAARRFRHWRDGLGMICFEGGLVPETGIPFVNRIEREARRRHRAAKQQRSPERFEAFAADALIELTMPEASGRRGPSTDLVIVCDLNAWRRGHVQTGEPCHILGGGPIPVEVARDLAEDAFLKVVLHDGKDICTVSHVGRKYTAELLTALDLGAAPSFGGRECVDCKRTWRLQRDHDDPVAHTGPTSYKNLKDRCYVCHAEKTERDRKAGLLGRKAKARGPGPPTNARSRRSPPARDPQ